MVTCVLPGLILAPLHADGDSLELKGCALVVICHAQTWRRARP